LIEYHKTFFKLQKVLIEYLKTFPSLKSLLKSLNDKYFDDHKLGLRRREERERGTIRKSKNIRKI